MALDYLSLEPAQTADAAIIWLHGLGASGYDFYSTDFPKQLGVENKAVRFIFPHAPMRAVTLNQGYVMPAWYDISELSKEGRDDLAGMQTTQAQIHELIEQQIQLGIASEKIILAGFSQGGAVSLYCALRYPERLGGIVGLSTYLPLAANLNGERSKANQNLPIFMAHGKDDSIVQLCWAEESRDYLLNLGYPIDWHLYPMEHELCLDEIIDLRAWLTKVL